MTTLEFIEAVLATFGLLAFAAVLKVWAARRLRTPGRKR